MGNEKKSDNPQGSVVSRNDGRPDSIASGVSWRILTVSANSGLSVQISQLIEKGGLSEPVCILDRHEDPRSLGQLIQGHKPNLCLVDVIHNTQDGFATIQAISQADPGVGIVALIGGNDPELILRCLRQGASEFMLQPFTLEQVAASLAKLAKTLPKDKIGPRNSGTVYAIMPAKGACGATTIATNLAFQWKRLGKKRVLLADLDPLGGTISFLLKVKCTYSFMDVMHRSSNLDTDLWKAMVATRDGVDILLAPEVLVEGVSDLKDATAIVNYARENYDVVLLDAGSVYGAWNLSQAQLADEVLLVSTNELPALQAAQRAMNYLDAGHVPRSKVRLIVNRYNSSVGLSRDVISTALNVEVYHMIQSDFEGVQRSLMEGKPLAAGSIVGKGMVELGERLAGHKQVQKKSTSHLSSLLSLFSRSSS